MKDVIPVGSILRCESKVLGSFTEGKRYVVEGVVVRDDGESNHTLTAGFIDKNFVLEYAGVNLDLSPLEVKKLDNILKSARMLHIGDERVIDDLLEKLKIGGNK